MKRTEYFDITAFTPNKWVFNEDLSQSSVYLKIFILLGPDGEMGPIPGKSAFI